MIRVAALIVGTLLAGCAGTSVSDIQISITPASATVPTGQTQQFTASAGFNTITSGPTWSVNGITNGTSAAGTITSTGFYTAPATVPSPHLVTIAASEQGLAADGKTEVTVTASVPVTITGTSGPGSGPIPVSSVSISVTPDTIASGGSATLAWSSASVTGLLINGQSNINGVAVGTAGSVPVSPTQTTSYQISGTGSNGPVSDTATLTVQPSTQETISITPSSGTVESCGNVSLTAVVSNDPLNEGVTWYSTFGPPPASQGPLTAIYTAPLVIQNTDVTIRAGAVDNWNVSGTVKITITPPSSSTVVCAM